MATIVVMPQLGNSVESCLITEWRVAEGDVVAVDQVLCEVETDKSSMDVQSTDAGTVLKLLWEEGDEVPVKDPLIIVGEPGEDISALVPGGTSEAPAAEAAPATAEEASPVAPAPAFATSASTGAVSPRARAVADAHGLDASAVAEGSGPGGRVIERDVHAHLAANPATAAARDAGAQGTGTGLGGRVTTADLAAAPAASEAPAPAAPAVAIPSGEFPGASESAPLKGIRKVVAERMMASQNETAPVSYSITAKAAGLLALRKKFKNAPEALGVNGITIGDLVGFALVKTLLKHPTFNSHLENGVFTKFENVHLAVAVDTPRGLLVPVIRGANAMNLKQFSAASKAAANGAIDGSISPDLLSGGTFTVSNLGSFGVETFTPVINRPQSAILGVAAITPRPVALPDGTVGVEQRIGFSLTADHQVIDGADAARFLRDLVSAIENIDITVLG